MLICGRSECQTTAGCAHRGPRGELCHFSNVGTFEKQAGWLTEVKRLHEYTDAEIAAEYHRRALRALGDQSVGIGWSTAPGTLFWR